MNINTIMSKVLNFFSLDIEGESDDDPPERINVSRSWYFRMVLGFKKDIVLFKRRNHLSSNSGIFRKSVGSARTIKFYSI